MRQHAGFTKIPFCKTTRNLRTLCIEEFSVGFKGHDKPFPAWYPYAFVGGIAALATALYVMG
jgi:hypothetical protein